MKQFKDLSQKFTSKEIAENYVFPNELTEKEKREEEKLLLEFKNKKLAKQTPEEKLGLKLLQLKFHMEDYLKTSFYNERFNFGFFLKKYINLIDKQNKEFASEINLDPTELSQIINSHRKPSDKIFVRLELHSNSNIPALWWYRLFEKEKEHELQTDDSLRKKESKYVKKRLRVSI